MSTSKIATKRPRLPVASGPGTCDKTLRSAVLGRLLAHPRLTVMTVMMYRPLVQHELTPPQTQSAMGISRVSLEDSTAGAIQQRIQWFTDTSSYSRFRRDPLQLLAFNIRITIRTTLKMTKSTMHFIARLLFDDRSAFCNWTFASLLCVTTASIL